jgi:hypothetical protein
MSHTLAAYKSGDVILSNKPSINNEGVFDLPIGTIIKFKRHYMKVQEQPSKMYCEGCVIKDYMISAERVMCDGLACFRNFRADQKNTVLKYTNEPITEIHSGKPQTELAL